MELRLESRALNEAIEATAEFFKTQRVVACCGDRLTLTCLCLAEPIRRAVVGAGGRAARRLGADRRHVRRRPGDRGP